MSFVNNAWEFLALTLDEKVKFTFILIMLAIFIPVKYFDKQNENEKVLTYTKQVERLAQIQNSVKDLADFVSQQQKQLKISRDTIQSLEIEKEKLKPMVEADRRVVEAILQIQADKVQSNIWFERGLGFMLGIIGSLVASLIFSIIRKRAS